MYERLQDIYRNSSDKVRAEAMRESEAESIYTDYVAFVERFAPKGGLLLDAGCGNGWSSYFLSRRGFKIVGVDLNAKAFDPATDEMLRFEEASVTELPFDDAAFDAVAAHQMLEHVPDPKRALDEMLRVLKPQGAICIVGPNLLSIGCSFTAVVRDVWRNRPLRRVFIREAGMSRHPFGNTIFESLGALASNSVRIVAKSLSPHASFDMREPDINPPFHADNDACYKCNPIDLEKYLTGHGCRVVQNGKPGRMRRTAMLAGGTWIAAIKLD